MDNIINIIDKMCEYKETFIYKKRVSYVVHTNRQTTLQLLKEYSCSQEVRQTLNIFILGLVVLLREWLENPDLESMEEYGKNFSCPHKTIFSSKSSII